MCIHRKRIKEVLAVASKPLILRTGNFNRFGRRNGPQPNELGVVERWLSTHTHGLAHPRQPCED